MSDSGFVEEMSFGSPSSSHSHEILLEVGSARQFAVPVLRREQFVQLATVLDVSLTDCAYMRFGYRHLAAALLMLADDGAPEVTEATGE